MESKKPKKSNLQKAAHLSGAGIQMGLTIYLGYLLGKYLDQKFDKNYLTQIITLAAIFLAMISLIMQANKLND